MTNPSSNTPKDHIHKIRETKFGLAPSGELLERNPLSDDLQRAIEELSEGLYSKQTHFILELIQNAEDNRYAESTKPDLTFILVADDPTGTPNAEGALLIVNNESGFRPEDVKALCAVGKTTKDKREGYVGEKGIGFKSVFVVSGQPHIFSAGYQFRFQEETDSEAELGYIIPYWISEIPSALNMYSDKTCIVLPLKPGKREQVARELQTIAPETILFLSTLQGLTVQIENQKSTEVIRDDTKRPLVQFLVDDGYAEFWVNEQTFYVPADLCEDKRVGIQSRKVSVALPLPAEGRFSRQVFAFLPTEVNSGFPFLINADFILSASRESIQLDRAWNQWLRDCIAPTFVTAFESLLHRPEHRATAYAHIPLLDDVEEDFFQPTVGTIHDDLRGRTVVWAFNSETFVTASDARLASQKFRNLLAPSQIPRQLQKTPLVHPKIQPYRKQLKAIGVQELSSEETIECLRDESWLASQDLGWFVDLYEYLSGRSWVTQQNPRDVNLLPIEGGELSNTTTQPIYFPSEESKFDPGLQEDASELLRITFLEPKIYELICENEDLKEWFHDTLGVCELTQANYCLDLARALNERRTEIGIPKLVRLTAYIRDQYDDLDSQIKRSVEQILPLALAGGTIIEQQLWKDHHPLVMPEAMDPDTGWQWVFEDPQDRAHMTVLSGAYLDNCHQDEARNQWKDFFRKLGATDAPLPRRRSWRLYTSFVPDDLTSHAREYFQLEKEYSTDGHELKDWLAPRWLHDCRDTHEVCEFMERRAAALLQWLVRQQSRFKYGAPRFYSAKYKWHYYQWKSKRFDSEFKQCLLETAWFPSTHGLKKPGEVFLNKPELREVFGDAIPYALEYPNEKVANWLGLRQTATREELLDYLKEYNAHPADQADRKVVQKIYRFLAERWQPGLREQFEKHALILVSKLQPKWVTAQQAVWPDLSDVFGTAYVYLQAEYEQELKPFFVDKVGVATQIEPKLYIQAWSQLANSENWKAEAVESALEHIYPEALRLAKQSDPPAWWNEFCAEAKVWTQSDRFEPASRVYIPDDSELKRLFAKEGVEFAWRPEKASFAEYQPLYHELEVRSLVEMVQATATIQEVADTDGVQPLLTPDAKKAICFYLWNAPGIKYEDIKETGLLEALLRTRERRVSDLTVSYKLGWRTVRGSNSATYWQQEQRVLYRVQGCPKDQLEIEMPAVLARRLSGGRVSRALENFIGRVLGASQVKAEGIIDKNGWSLPLEEKQWLGEVLVGQPKLEPDQGPGSTSESSPDDIADITPEEAVAEMGITEDRSEIPDDRTQETPAGPVGTSGDSRGTGGSGGDGKPHPGSTIGKGGRKPTTKRKSRSKLRSYVIPEGDEPDGETDSDAALRRSEVDQAGIRRVLEYEHANGRTPTEMPHHQKGYDIKSVDEAGNVRCIEVKSLSSDWGTRNAAGLTKAQFEMARRLGDKVWLYVVERATDEDYQIHAIQDPANRINQYLFDDGWQHWAEAAERT